MADPLVRQGCTLYDTLVDVDRCGIIIVADLMLLYRYGKIIDEIGLDFVITYTIKPNIYGDLTCNRGNAPYAVNVTGLGETPREKRVRMEMAGRKYME